MSTRGAVQPGDVTQRVGVEVIRARGVRTRDEIDQERYALKAARGDFVVVPPGGASAGELLAAAQA